MQNGKTVLDISYNWAQFNGLNPCWTFIQAKDEYLKEDVLVLPVQMNGKLRGTIEVPAGADEETAFAAAIKSGNFDKFLEGKEIKKKIYVPGRILNLIIK